MPLAAFKDMMADARRGRYAVGYFESWNLESLLAVADAAEATRSPVILGFSGVYRRQTEQLATDPLRCYAALGLETCRALSVPACLLFNESPHVDEVLEAIDLGFGLVMFADETLPPHQRIERILEVVDRARLKSVAVEAEIAPPPGFGDDSPAALAQPRLTDPDGARDFVERTGVDALAVNIGQAHLGGRSRVGLDLGHLVRLREALDVALVLHAASSVAPSDLAEAARLGIGKINVGSNLKRAYFEALRQACRQVGDDFHPYDVVGSGAPGDVLTAARLALQETVEDLMRLFGSAGRCPAPV